MMIQFVQMNRMASSGIDYKWHDWKNLFLRTQCPEEEAGDVPPSSILHLTHHVEVAAFLSEQKR